jgi:hypothetical protein
MSMGGIDGGEAVFVLDAGQAMLLGGVGQDLVDFVQHASILYREGQPVAGIQAVLRHTRPRPCPAFS